jgi:hypothetical protein
VDKVLLWCLSVSDQKSISKTNKKAAQQSGFFY